MVEIEKFDSGEKLLETFDKLFEDGINSLQCISELEVELNKKCKEIEVLKNKNDELRWYVEYLYNAIAESLLETKHVRDAVRKKLNHGIYDDIN